MYSLEIISTDIYNFYQLIEPDDVFDNIMLSFSRIYLFLAESNITEIPYRKSIIFHSMNLDFIRIVVILILMVSVFHVIDLIYWQFFR